jgi:stage II sporulation protein D
MTSFAKKFTLVMILGLLAGASDIPSKPADVRVIRVAVLRAQKDIRLSVSGPFEVSDAATLKVLWKSRNLSTVKAAAVPEGLKIGTKIFSSRSLLITDHRLAGIIVNKRPYRGDAVLTKDKDGALLVVNVVDLEFYVKGVLYHEISNKWPMDAIKAQAVATRTYALYQEDVMKAQAYDVTADTSSQVYGGFASEKNKTNRGVNFTAGEVLTFQGKIFPAYFYATCGGKSESASELWKTDMEPLRGGRVCPYCATSPHYFWRIALSLGEIQKKCGPVYTLKEPLESIAIAERTVTGRARTLEFMDANGEVQQVSAKDLRRLLGSDILRSTNFSVNVEDGKAVFEGKGWGHGVGLCQWGAMQMAKDGFSYVEILKFYYPGATISKVK